MPDSQHELLSKVFFFSDLSDDEISSLAALSAMQQVRAGDIVFREGDPPEHFYVVARGAVAVWKNWGEPDAELLALHGPGQLFGEMALVDELPRSATVIVETGGELLYLAGKDFRRFISENGNIALSIMKRLSSMVRRSNESFVEGLRRRNTELEQANNELRATQRELLRSERLSTLGKMSGMILHDLRNPLSVLRSHAEMMLMHLTDQERLSQGLQLIIREADRMNALANELLDYSRGEIRLETGIVTGEELLDGLRSTMTARLSGRDILLDLDSNLTQPMILDRDRMLRALVNLVENSRKAIGKHGRISVTMEEQALSVHIVVRDTGRGMSPETLEHIFEPFYSAEHGGGTGLGMVIVRNVIEAHDGTVQVESTPGEGTTVTIHLPAHGKVG
ncbi:MAG: histidine kinase [Spirochaetaceae bacterium]|nr:MAG: histidine kinase [Spirochaetaceae bacterium]